jgi:hypothetical protein
MRAAMLDFTSGPALLVTENAVLEHASTRTARLNIDPQWELRTKNLRANVSVDNPADQKFPSRVNFRRTFIAFEVKGEVGQTLWVFGRSNDARVTIDQHSLAIPGEFWSL